MKGKRASSTDVAVRAGVSRTTVSFVLNNTPGKAIPEETRQKVLGAARVLGYTPDQAARSVAMVKHRSIGFFIPHSGYISSDAYIFRVIEGMTPTLNKERFRLVLQPLKVRDGNYLALARRDDVDGIILMNTHDEDRGLSELIKARFPLVVIGTVSRGDVCQVDIDNKAGAVTAVSHLLSLGHRAIGMIGHAPLKFYAARERQEGWRTALREARVRPRADWYVEADLTEQSGYKAMKALLGAKDRPTAVFAGNDVVAYGAMQAIKDAGLTIPGDLSIVGMDDDLLSRYMNPPLTTVSNPAAGVGAEAARLVIGKLRTRRGSCEHLVLPTALALRASAAPRA
jgi:LacI family transcriptional regulator